MTAPSAGENDTAMPNGPAPMGRLRALAARLGMAARSGPPSPRPRNTLVARSIGGILVIGAAFAWYLLFRSVFSYFTDDSDYAWSGMTAGEYLAAVKERQPDIRSDFDVYLVENRLIYRKETCTQGDVGGWFFVQVDPVSPDDLPHDRRPQHTFGFGDHGRISGETCWADFPLPDYDVAAIRTGQFLELEGGHQWVGNIRLYSPTAGMTTGEYLSSVKERKPDLRSNFDVHLVENRLVYVKEACTQGDFGGRFFLHLVPVSPDDLPDRGRPHGFDNLDFQFDQYGAGFEGTCWAEVPLPDYAAAEIRTGQHVEEEGGYRTIWTGKIRLYSLTDGMTTGEYLSALKARQPDIRSDFDVHLVENRLVYVKEACTQGDFGGRFFLHLVPVSPDDLPDRGRPHGFDNLDFQFDQYGAGFEGTCWAEVPLPDYAAAEIRTGQHVEEEGGYRTIWTGKIRSDFEVRLIENRLIYAKGLCTREDVDSGFLLFVLPVSPEDLPSSRRPYGFDNLSFRFDQHAVSSDGACWAEVPLPDYDIAAIRAGQYVEEEGALRYIWEEEIRLE